MLGGEVFFFYGNPRLENKNNHHPKDFGEKRDKSIAPREELFIVEDS